MSAPEGWVLVPVEPTKEMLAACAAALGIHIKGLADSGVQCGPFGYKVRTDHKATLRYRAMIAAAPKPPVQP